MSELDEATKVMLRQVAEETADRTVRKTFITLGIDPEEPIEAQQDMAFLRGLRKQTGFVVSAILASIGVAVMNAWHFIQSLNAPHPN